MIFEDIVRSGYGQCKKYDSYIDYLYGSLRSRDEPGRKDWKEVSENILI